MINPEHEARLSVEVSPDHPWSKIIQDYVRGRTVNLDGVAVVRVGDVESEFTIKEVELHNGTLTLRGKAELIYPIGAEEA